MDTGESKRGLQVKKKRKLRGKPGWVQIGLFENSKTSIVVLKTGRMSDFRPQLKVKC